MPGTETQQIDHGAVVGGRESHAIIVAKLYRQALIC